MTGTSRRRPGGLRSKLSYSNVVATVALFAALGGGAYAASKIHSNDIAKNAVLSKHIKKGQVKGSDALDHSLDLDETTVFKDAVIQDFGNISQGACTGITKSVVKPVNNFDQVVVVPDTTDSAWTSEGLIAFGSATGSGSASQIRLRVCNVGSATDPPSTTFEVLVFRGQLA